MKMPWRGENRTTKLVTMFALLLLVSIGLCAGNLALFSHYGAIGGGQPNPPASTDATMLLMGTGFVELAGMAVGMLGLIVVGVIAIVSWIIRLRSKDNY
jgi:ABC-type transporter Mla subunit MlaD